jgi:hypothetical protein
MTPEAAMPKASVEAKVRCRATRQMLGTTIPRRLMMTTRSFASLAFKLLGTYLLVESVAGLRMIPTALYSFPRNIIGLAFSTYIIELLLPFVFAITFGVVLIAKSNLFAEWAVSAEGQVEEVVPEVKATQSLAFSVLGTFFFVSAVCRLVSVITTFMTTRPVQSVMFRPVVTFSTFWPQLAEGLVQLAIGAYLFFCAGSLSKLWHRIQESRIPSLTGEQKS